MSGISLPEKIDSIANHIVKEHLKGKIPLFVIGSGISRNLNIPNNLKDKAQKLSIPTMVEMIEKLYSLYNISEKGKIPAKDREDLERRFKIWDQQLKQDRKVDRNNVGGILEYFQEKKYLKEEWIKFNQWLLHECVDEKQKIGIINAPFSTAHEKVAELYEKVNAFCLTTNFDGLFYKALQFKYDENSTKRTHSYYIKEQAERFFTYENSLKKNYAEIQVRGDIFFVKCDPIWCSQYNICGEPFQMPTRIWESKPDPLKCRRGEYMKPFISFPGTYKKDREVREILSVLWRYLTHKVSCVITIGIGGWWDPILVAFLSDLVRERNIPFIDVNTSPEHSYIAKEIVSSDSSLKISANQFMDILNKFIGQAIGTFQKSPKIQIKYSRSTESKDEFWDEIFGKWEMSDVKEILSISDFEKKLLRHPLVDITEKFAQLGLKSKWWGIRDHERWRHNRLNHSKGVMKIATFLYEKVCKNSGRPERAEEKQLLRIAALLHDIGHLPFSHLIEEVFQELNWKPAGYIESFSHDYYTEEKVKKIFEDANLKEELDKIKYNVGDLIRLINGEFGIGFLDAIINGPIDADKIDYVFRDVESIKVFTHIIDPQSFLKEIGSRISISSAGLLILNRGSARAAFTILKQREKLYKEFYLFPAIRLLEKAVKFIVITYFVHTYNTFEVPENIKKRFLDNKTQFSDLGAIRIAMASEELEKLSDTYKSEADIEMKIIQYMKEILDGELIDKRVKGAIEECFSLIKDVNQDTRCKDEEEKRRQKLSVSEFPRERIGKIRYDAKTVILRFPGAVLMEVLPPFEFFKDAGARKPRARSDGTNEASKCILSPELIQMVEKDQGGKREQGQVRVYKIGEESEANRALGFFERLFGEERRLEEVE